MQYFTVEAGTPREAIEKMRRHYGEEARILTHKNVRRGGLFGFFAREAVEITGYVPAAKKNNSPSRGSEIEEAKKKILETAKREQSLQQILKEIQSLKENFVPGGPAQMLPGQAKIEELLAANDFDESFRRAIHERIRKEFSVAELDNIPLLMSSVLEWIGQGIRIYPAFSEAGQERKIFIIVGPTGVGKTTSIAKLAAIYGIGNSKVPARRVQIVTIDNYRIAARRQIETYAEIMRVPVAFAESAAEFQKVLALASDKELVLVDTIGKSPRDLARLAEMKDVLDTAGSESEIHLALSATTKASDVEEILQQFEPFKYKAVILTKLDETQKVGNIVSVLSRREKALSFIADGQGVPQDIEEASVLRLLMSLDGFRINREGLEDKFGPQQKIAEKFWK
jgi:flagellar biosynthesis protein FlhF